MDSFKDVLEAAQAYCKTQMAEPTYNLYIDGLEPISFEDSSHITLSVRNDFICKIVTDRYLGLLKEAFKTVLGFDVLVNCSQVTYMMTKSGWVRLISVWMAVSRWVLPRPEPP